MRMTIPVLSLSAITAVLALLALAVWADGQGSARATLGETLQDPDGVIVGIDMITAGNDCPQDVAGVGADCSLGPIDNCVSVNPGDPVTFDVFVDDLELDSHLGHGFLLDGWPASGTDGTPPQIVSAIHQGAPTMVTSRAGAMPIDFNETAPDADLPYDGSGTGDIGTAEYNPPYTQGVLDRYNLDTTGATPGVYGLRLTDVSIGRDTALDADYIGYERGGNISVAAVWDANFTPQYGLIAIGQSCSGATATPLPTFTPTPPPTGTPTPSPTPTGTPTPGAVTLVAGWNHVCYRGPQQPIAEALGEVSPGVLSIYRLRPDQAYDRWFPDRPEISNIADMGSYQPFLILMAGPASWNQGEAGTPPSSATLGQGWNSVCYSGQTKATDAATAGIAGKFSVLYSLGSDQGWMRFAPDRPDLSNLLELQRFTAVLVLATPAEGTVWTFDP